MKHFEKSRLCGYALAVLALAMMLYGVSRGEMDIVLKKAINICLECVGIG